MGCDKNRIDSEEMLGYLKDAGFSFTYDETEADIIVVGGGAAGMTAAITAHDLGASVILLEKSAVLGGNTICSANGINAADSAVQLADEKYQAAQASVEGLEGLQMNNPDADEDLVKAFAENSGEVIDWLGTLGVNFEVDIQEDDRNSEQNYYMLKDTTDGSTAITMINKVTAELKESGITVYTLMDAHDLVTDETGRVTGVTAMNDQGEDVTFSGKTVLLATGGFGQNSDLVGEVNPALANAVTDEVAPTTGEGLNCVTRALRVNPRGLKHESSHQVYTPSFSEYRLTKIRSRIFNSTLAKLSIELKFMH